MFSPFKNKKDKVQHLRENPAGYVLFSGNQTYSNSKDLKAFYEEGYKQNVIAYKCIKEISTAIAGIQLEVWKKGKEGKDTYVENHPIYALLNRPNPIQSGKLFMRELVTNYLYAGNAYVIKDAKATAPAKELWNIPSDKVEIKAGRNGMPRSYKIGDSEKMIIEVDQLTGESRILHIKDVNPKSDLQGLSPFEPAAISADLHNAALKWNYNLVKNGAKPDYCIKGENGSSLTQEQKASIKEWWTRNHQGFANAGKPLVMSGLDVQILGLSPKDMDFNESLKETANYICLAFGVPPVLITGEGNTFNNVKEARESFYENTVLPMLDEILAELNRWLVKPFGEELFLKYNPDAISALESKRERKYKRMVEAKNAGLITIDEAREELGFDVRGGLADEIFINSGSIPIEDAGLDNSDVAKQDQKSYDAQV